MKVCSKCKIEQGLSCFYKDRRNSDGLFSQCKSCISLTNKVRGINPLHRKNKKENDKRYRESHKEKVSQYHKKYYKQNRDRVIASSRRRYKNNDSLKEYSKSQLDIWRKKEGNQQKLNTVSRECHKKNRESLSDSYVTMSIKRHRSGSFKDIDLKDIPKELIELKRLSLKLKREIKNYNHEAA